MPGGSDITPRCFASVGTGALIKVSRSINQLLLMCNMCLAQRLLPSYDRQLYRALKNHLPFKGVHTYATTFQLFVVKCFILVSFVNQPILAFSLDFLFSLYLDLRAFEEK